MKLQKQKNLRLDHLKTGWVKTWFIQCLFKLPLNFPGLFGHTVCYGMPEDAVSVMAKRIFWKTKT